MNRFWAWFAAFCFVSCTPAPSAAPAESPPQGMGDPPPPPHTLESEMSFHGGGDDEPAADSSATTSESSPAASASSPAASEPPAEAAPEAPTRSPRDILTSPGAAFMIDYGGSGLKEAAENKCDKENADDPQARAQCMTKARDEFQADVLSFQKAGGGWALVIYKRKGSSLAEVSKALVDFADDTASAVTVKIKSEQGTRPIFKRARQFVVTVPNTYSVVLTDPDLGELHYDAKIGLVGAGANQ